MFEVTVPVLTLERLQAALDEQHRHEIVALAERAREGLARRTVWNISSTATGGGVAEMLRGLIGYALAAGIDIRWLVIEGAPPFFDVTKRVHNGLHGDEGDGGELGPTERAAYESIIAREADGVSEMLRPSDVVLLHDPQTAGLSEVARACGAIAVWRCHVGTETRNEWTDRAWSFLRPYLETVDATVFSRAEYIPGWLAAGDGAEVIRPAIDPASSKNDEVDQKQVTQVLTSAGLLVGTTPVGSGVDHPATLLREGGPFPRDARLVVQVSRWDRLKDMAGVLDAFVHGIVDGVPGSDAHLLLAGPSVAGVTDDPEGARTLDDVTTRWRALPEDARRRVGLASLDMSDGEENALVVNALQRHAAIVVQKSLQEGFGLTVAEAMWKSRPVVASAVGGIQDQITDGVSGRLVDPRDARAFVSAVTELLDDPMTSHRLGAAARQRVEDEFLPNRQLRQWLDLILRLCSSGVVYDGCHQCVDGDKN